MGTPLVVARKIRALLKRALVADIALDEFYRACPEPSELDDFLLTVCDDLEEAITHTPGRWLRGGVDRNAWETSDLYKRLRVDAILLEHFIDEGWQGSGLLRCYHRVIQNIDLDPVAIRERVAEELARDPESRSRRTRPATANGDDRHERSDD